MICLTGMQITDKLNPNEMNPEVRSFLNEK